MQNSNILRAFGVLILALAVCQLAPEAAAQTWAKSHAASQNKATSKANSTSPSKAAATKKLHGASALSSSRSGSAKTVTKTAAGSSKPGQVKEAAAEPKTESQPEPAEAPTAPGLSDAIKLYRSAPDQATWQPVWEGLTRLLSSSAAVRLPAGRVMQANAGLSELNPKIIDAEGGRVWSFPLVPQCQSVIFQWQGAAQTAVERTVTRRGRTRVVRQVAYVPYGRAQVFKVPESVHLSDAHLVRSFAAVAAPSQRGKKAKAPAQTVVLARYLVLAGSAKSTNDVWLQAYKLAGENWVPSPEVFSSLPPFLTANIAGAVSFSGNDLVFSVTGKDGAQRPSQRPPGKPAPKSSGYRIVLKLVGDRYTLGGKGAEDAPALIAFQFVQAIHDGHLDIAKGWLVDSKLINIPKYINIVGRPPTQPFKLIPMTNPSAGVSRYRVMTFEKNDLIIDIGRVKNVLAVKAVFIAPPDPLAQKLVGTLPAPVSDKTVEERISEPGVK